MENSDYYNLLNIKKDASPDEIRNAYRELALKYHPDRNQNSKEAAEKMQQVNEAYAVLSDAVKKREYDKLRRQFGQSARSQFRQTYSDQDIFKGSDIHHIFEELSQAFGLRGFDDIFREFDASGHRKRFRFEGPGFFGGGFFFFGTFGRGRYRQLPFVSSGLRKIAGFMLKNLTGKKMPWKGEDIRDVIHLSPEHAQNGGPYAYFHKKKNKKLVVKIPPNVRPGQHVRLSGMGGDGKNGGEPGDLYLRILVNVPIMEKAKLMLGNFFGKK